MKQRKKEKNKNATHNAQIQKDDFKKCFKSFK